MDFLSKDDLRAQARDHRNRLPPDLQAPEDAAALFKEHVCVGKEQIVAAYWPKGKEFDVRYILDDLLGQGIVCALPVVTKDNRVMPFARWDAEMELEENAFGVMQPKDKDYVTPDIILVPMLAFDRRGYRLGYGGGHYDATLEALRAEKDILVIGVGYAEQAVLFNLPVEEHDQKLDMILTPRGVQDFRN